MTSHSTDLLSKNQSNDFQHEELLENISLSPTCKFKKLLTVDIF